MGNNPTQGIVIDMVHGCVPELKEGNYKKSLVAHNFVNDIIDPYKDLVLNMIYLLLHVETKKLISFDQFKALIEDGEKPQWKSHFYYNENLSMSGLR